MHTVTLSAVEGLLSLSEDLSKPSEARFQLSDNQLKPSEAVKCKSEDRLKKSEVFSQESEANLCESEARLRESEARLRAGKAWKWGEVSFWEGLVALNSGRRTKVGYSLRTISLKRI